MEEDKPGRCLLTKNEAVQTGELKGKEPKKKLEAVPITLFHSATLRSGSLLAVNDKFLCYHILNQKGRDTAFVPATETIQRTPKSKGNKPNYWCAQFIAT